MKHRWRSRYGSDDGGCSVRSRWASDGAAWQVATAADEDLAETYRNEAMIAWAIDLDTLPRYATAPAMLVRNDDLD